LTFSLRTILALRIYLFFARFDSIDLFSTIFCASFYFIFWPEDGARQRGTATVSANNQHSPTFAARSISFTGGENRIEIKLEFSVLEIGNKRTEAAQEMSSNSSKVASTGPNTQKRRPHANPPKSEQSKENAEIDDDLIWARGH